MIYLRLFNNHSEYEEYVASQDYITPNVSGCKLEQDAHFDYGISVPVTGVTLDKASIELNNGETQTLVATVMPLNASTKTVVWETSDSTVATVTNGVVTAVGCGNATITVTTVDGGYTAQCQTSVANPVTGVTLDKYIVNIDTGDTYQLVATTSPSDACGDKSVTWSSSNNNVATVSNNGLVTAVASGSAVITVTTTVGSHTATCAVEVAEEHDYSKDYLTFDVLTGGTISWISLNNVTKTISYSKDNGQTWTDITSSNTGETISVNAGDKVLFKGENAKYGTQVNYCSGFSGGTAYYNVEGNIMSLIGGDNFTGLTSFSTNFVFYRLFYASNVVSAKNLVMPVTTLTASCYRAMFGFAHSLIEAPELPATTLADSCYWYMFEECPLTTSPDLLATTLATASYGGMFHKCTSLTTAPVLSATSATNKCYRLMFAGCTSLTTAPVISATTLASECYYGMFSGCTSLTTAPNTLLATTLEDNCYNSMFAECTSLTTAPVISATTMASRSCYCMFQGCTALTTVQQTLPATTMANQCYSSMYYGCTSLTTAPNLPATTMATSAYTLMFYYCTSLTVAPNTLPATTLANYCYSRMFDNCTSLTTAPSISATTLATRCYSGMFSGCTSLTAAPELLATTLADYCYFQMFRGCTSLTVAPTVSATTLADNCCRDMFYNCTGMTTAQQTLPATTLVNQCYQGMYFQCKSLTNAPELPATTLANNCYNGMFKDCISLTTAPSLPATTMANSAYTYMFSGCTSLTTAPVLSASTLVDRCYYGMFGKCSNLNSITCLATDISASDCTTNWVVNVASSGTFTKANIMSSWTRGDSGIPTNWIVRDDTYVYVTGVTISPTAETVNKNDTVTLTATVLPADATDKSVTWSTSDGNVATVANGVVTGVGCGSATITVTTTDGGYTAQCTTTVENHVTSVDLDTYVLTLNTGGTYQLVASVSPSDACNKSVTWSSDNTSVATVDSTGLVSGVTTGSATVTVTSVDNSSATKNCAITVSEGQHATGVSLSDTAITITADTTYTLTATVTPADAINKNVTWSSSDSNIATVDSNGVVSGVASGDVTITVTTVDGGFTAQCSVSVANERDYSLEYFTIESLVDNNTVKFIVGSGTSTPNNFAIDYSTDSGSTWSTIQSGQTRGSVVSIGTINSGDTMLLRSTANTWGASYSAHSSVICSENYIVYGNVMSLLFGENFVNQTNLSSKGTFTLAGLFWANQNKTGSETTTATTNTTLISAENLVLPATTLKNECYNGMFRGCVNLKYSPKELPALTLVTSVYSSMFDECHNLETTPDIMATGLTNNTSQQCRRMFRIQNTSVTPKLTVAPTLRIGALMEQTYQEMFKGQKSLNYIKCLATSISATKCTENWVQSVQTTNGTFVRDANTNWGSCGNSKIPCNWRVEDAMD